MNYLENEMQLVQQERKQKMKPEVSNRLFLGMMMYLCFFAIYTGSMYANTPVHNLAKNGQGCAWKCQKCEKRVWRDSSRKDWAGNYNCPNCGTPK